MGRVTSGQTSGDFTEKHCVMCGEGFEVGIDDNRKKFCTGRCRDYAYADKRKAGQYGIRFRVLNRDNFTCRYCGASPLDDESVKLEVDHIHARARGGYDQMGNMITACKPCNQGKRDYLLDRESRDIIEKYLESVE